MFDRVVLLALYTICWTFVTCSGFLEQHSPSDKVSCYNEAGRAQRCSSPFVNAAFESRVEVTNTCGFDGAEEFCRQTDASGEPRECDVCYETSFPPEHLTDFHNNRSPTWWQSSTMMKEVQWPNSVNLTIHLGKAYEITYVRLRFQSSLPESFSIYKRTRPDGPWVPYEFYSASCQRTYKLPQNGMVRRDDDVVCRDEYSDISPTSGAAVAFSTLQSRPGANNFEESATLQEWVTATDIRIVLNRINTFRDEVFGDPIVLKSYYYAISDIAIGGRCQCHGHASECNGNKCKCEHNTTGPDCGQCLPLYNDRPWKRATSLDANECQACNCNGLADQCFFDKALFDKTGHGGHCMKCRENTAGPNCELCTIGYHRDRSGRCAPCHCDPVGSKNQQCTNGACQCKPGVTGERCDRCLPNYYNFGQSGCRTCECSLAGSLDNKPECISEGGSCRCKENVQGQNCDECRPGFFGLNAEDPLGCAPCFCYGHSNKCTSSTGYIQFVQSDFKTDLQGWKGVTDRNKVIPLEWNFVSGAAGISAPPGSTVYFHAPERYLGDQRSSYNLFLTFDLRVGEERVGSPQHDLIIEGSNGQQIFTSITSQNNPSPRTVNHNYRFRLSEHHSYGWYPQLSAFEYVSILSNIKSIKIRGSYSEQGVGFVDNVKLETSTTRYGNMPAHNVERCECPQGYLGQFCESCAPGYRREAGRSDPFGRCIPCDCNGHSSDCDPALGRCVCEHNTAGKNCERCAPGYYGNALAGTPYDCKPCPCPNQGECIELAGGEIACTECQTGYTGNRCEECADGYFGDPEGRRGPRRACEKCTCNDNIDPNAVGNCDRFTGQCLKCIYNTDGFNCENCLPGHYGNALAHPKGQCQPCHCDPHGTYHESGSSCDRHTGQCRCKPNVFGLKCDQCLDGYWNSRGVGCESCNCDRIGSHNTSCDLRSGQCFCKPGVSGLRCDGCAEKHYGFSLSGCSPCNCNPHGSAHEQCDATSGKCFCRPNIEGRTCDRCSENRFLSHGQCVDCPECYSLVQQTANQVKVKVTDLRVIINYMLSDTFNPSDEIEFMRNLHHVNHTIFNLYWRLRRYGSGGGIHADNDQLTAVQVAINDFFRIITTVYSSYETAHQSSDQAKHRLRLAEEMVNEMERKLTEAEQKMENDARVLLWMALEAQQKQGHKSHALTRIANEARVLVERQEVDLNSVEDILRQALSISEEALKLAEQMIGSSSPVNQDIIRIRYKLTTLREQQQAVDMSARNSLEQAKKVYDESWSLFVQVTNLEVPKVNLSIEEFLNRFRHQANELERELRIYEEKNSRVVIDIQNLLRNGEHIFSRAQSEQQILDELLANADAIKGNVENSILRCMKIYEEAIVTLRTLEEFDNSIRRSKEIADRALEMKSTIIQQIRMAQTKTQQANDNIANAERDAKLAKTNAESAQRLAEDALKNLNSILNETSTAREKIVNVKEESVKLKVKIDDVEKRLNSLEETSREDARSIAEAREKTDLAKARADEVHESLKTAQTTITSIMGQINYVEDMDVHSLDRLEMQLNMTETMLMQGGSLEGLDRLKEFDYRLTLLVNDYNNQLMQFHADVENIRHINATIPRICLSISNLEPLDIGKK